MNIRKNDGFTLLELCIVLIIIGVLLSIFLNIFTHSYFNRSKTVTLDRLESIEKRIATYLEINGHLPCPAPIKEDNSSPAYKHSLSCDDIDKDSFSREEKGYFLDDTNKEETVIIGHVPTRTLNIPDVYGEDFWNSPITYAVTLSLTKKEYYDQQGGAIAVVDRFNHSVISPDMSAQYVLIAHGKDMIQFNSSECSDKLDSENCDLNSTFRSADFSDGTNHYDDYITYKSWIYYQENPGSKCDIKSFLINKKGISDKIVEKYAEDNARAFYPRSGETTLICEDALLKKLGEEDCILLTCDTQGNVNIGSKI